MKLKEYLDTYHCRLMDIAADLGVTKQYIWLISSGRVNPSAMLAHQINAYTGGKVEVNEIRKCTKTCSPGCACSKEK